MTTDISTPSLPGRTRGTDVQLRAPRAANPYESLSTLTEAAIEGIFALAECLGCSHRTHDAHECRVTPFFAVPGERCRCNLQDGKWPE